MKQEKKDNRFAYSSKDELHKLSEEEYVSIFDDEKEKPKKSNVIKKALDLGLITLGDIIKAGKKDISKLRKTKKLIHRDGKVFLSTYYEKTGERDVEKIEEKFLTTDIEKMVEDGLLETGKHIEVKTKVRTLSGMISTFTFHDKDGNIYAQLITESGSAEWVNLKRVKSIREYKPEEKTIDTASTDIFPEDFKDFGDFKKGVGMGGSSEVRMVEYNGEKFVIKKERERGKSEQLELEVKVDELYRKLGYKTPVGRIYTDSEGNTYKVTKLINGVEIGALTGDKKSEAAAEVKKGFVLDCFLANWDVIGAGGDNILVSGKDVYRIDNGGSVYFRAKGKIKEVDEIVTELTSMKKGVFADITDGEIKEQLDLLIGDEKNKNILKDFVKTLPDRYGRKFAIRLGYLIADYSKSLKPDLEKEEVKKDKSKEKLRDSMPSLLTQNYFDNGWDELELEGNEGIKDGIKKHIIEVEKENESFYKSQADKYSITVDEVKAEMQAFVEKYIGESNFFRATHEDVTDKVFNESGRFKTQFEPGISSDGTYDRHLRSRVESIYFGFRNDINHDLEKRPVYGYFSNHEKGVLNSDGEIPPPNSTANYGKVLFKIKRDVAMKKATFCISDSLGFAERMACTPVAKPHFTSLGRRIELSKIREYSSIEKGKELSSWGYTEVQYHNQLTKDDIEEINIPSGHYKNGGTYDFGKINYVVNSMHKFAAESGNKDIKTNIF